MLLAEEKSPARATHQLISIHDLRGCIVPSHLAFFAKASLFREGMSNVRHGDRFLRWLSSSAIHGKRNHRDISISISPLVNGDTPLGPASSASTQSSPRSHETSGNRQEMCAHNVRIVRVETYLHRWCLDYIFQRGLGGPCEGPQSQRPSRLSRSGGGMATKSGERYAEDLVVVVAALRAAVCRGKRWLCPNIRRGGRPIRIQGREEEKRKLRRPQPKARSKCDPLDEVSRCPCTDFENRKRAKAR